MKRRTKAPRGYSACRISLIDLRAAAFQAAARVYPGASPYMYPARTTPGHWNTQCDVHWHYQFQRIALVPYMEYDDNHTYSHHAREGKASFPIAIAAQDAHYLPLFNCNPLQLNTCLYRQKPSISFFFFPHLLFTTMSSAASCVASIAHGTYRVARGGTSNAAVPTVGWTQPHTVNKRTPLASRHKESAQNHPLGTSTYSALHHNNLTARCSLLLLLSNPRL
jgi:hypothetical protein